MENENGSAIEWLVGYCGLVLGLVINKGHITQHRDQLYHCSLGQFVFTILV